LLWRLTAVLTIPVRLLILLSRLVIALLTTLARLLALLAGLVS
jgi:hypothetical protein